MRRRDLLQIEALRQKQSRQVSASTSAGLFSASRARTNALLASWVLHFETAESESTADQYVYAETPQSAGLRISRTRAGYVDIRYNGYSIFYSILYGNRQIAVIVEASQARVYIDGVLSRTEVHDFVDSDITGTTLGAYNASRTYPWYGKIFSMRRFNYALTDGEVSALWNGGKPEDYVLPAAMKSGCEAEYLPQNILAEKVILTKTDTFDLMDTTSANHVSLRYSEKQTDATIVRKDGKIYCNNGVVAIDSGRPIVSLRLPYYEVGKYYRIKVKYTLISGDVRIFTVGNCQSGTFYVNSNSYDSEIKTYEFVSPIMRCNASSGEFYTTPYTYFGQSIADSEFSIDEFTIETFEPKALPTADEQVNIWLDSAAQIPLNDEYLPPLLESIGGDDALAIFEPEIIY